MADAELTSNPSPGVSSESDFLAQIEAPQIDVPRLLAALEELRKQNQADAAESRAELLQDTLVERKQADAALAVLQRRAHWAALARRSDGNWLQEALDICGDAWEQKAVVEEAGFEKGVPPVEAVRRLRLLRSLRENVLCHDRTWGLGVVTRVDSFYKRVEIDFERKLGHQLSMSYAAETLELVDDDHLLVWKKRKPDDLRALVQNQPAEVVRMALRSFGPLTLTQLQTLLTRGIVAEPDWKRFWDQARKELKKDAHVQVPAARSEPLRIVETTDEGHGGWFLTLSRERELTTVVGLLEELAGGKEAARLTPDHRAVVADRLAFAVKGAGSRDLGLLARLTMVADALEMGEAVAADRREAFLGESVFVETMRQLPVRHSRLFLRHLGAREGNRLFTLLLGLLPRMEIGTLNESMAYLLENGQEERVAAVYKARMDLRKPSLEMLNWLSRNLEKRGAWNLGAMGPVVAFMLDVLEEEASGERLKAQNQLRERFAKTDWLKGLMEELETRDIEQLLLRIKDSPAWPTLDRQSIMAHMVKLRPELGALLATKVNKGEGSSRGPVTSERSYRERQLQLDRIVNIEIPKVAKDIAIARSYGDLRENFEFKAAKEAQTILFHRRDELMRQLRQVTPTDFKEFPTDKAGVATTVTVEYADGKRERYHILGEWDGDTNLGIIASSSRMAEALAGHRAGEEITVPAEHGETRCRVVEVGALADEVREWMAGR